MPVLLAGLLLASIATRAAAQAPDAATRVPERPNIVLMFPDNLGTGEVSSYGGARGVPTPNIDRIAEEGIRLTNFNVEYSCVVSRIALLTGRYAVRTGEGYRGGMTLWEVTIAEALRTEGYATALFGKWHVGGDDWKGRREPQHQGFDEWWGIPESSNTAQFSSFEGFDPKRTELPYIWQGRAKSLLDR
ncbi:MAG: sulfatase-like hydrolase/transferase [Vicinamibacteria bacterium]